MPTQSQFLYSLHKNVASCQNGSWVEPLSALRTLVKARRCCLIPMPLDTQETVAVSAGKRCRIFQCFQAYGTSKCLWSPGRWSHYFRRLLEKERLGVFGTQDDFIVSVTLPFKPTMGVVKLNWYCGFFGWLKIHTLKTKSFPWTKWHR